MCPRFLFVDTIKSVHKAHHPYLRTLSTHGRNRTLTSGRFERFLDNLDITAGRATQPILDGRKSFEIQSVSDTFLAIDFTL